MRSSHSRRYARSTAPLVRWDGRALEKTHRVGLIPAVLKRSTHGPLHERLTAAGIQPDFDVPSPPSLKRGLGLLGAVALTFMIAISSPWLAFAVLDDSSEIPLQMAVALPVYGVDSLETLALEAQADGRWRDAAVLFEAVLRVSPDNELARYEVLHAWASAGECDRVIAVAEELDHESNETYAVYVEDLADWCRLTGGI